MTTVAMVNHKRIINFLEIIELFDGADQEQKSQALTSPLHDALNRITTKYRDTP